VPRILLSSLVLSIVLGACGGGDDDRLAQTVSTTSSTTTTTEAPAEGSTTTSTSAPDGPRDLQAVLVRLEELPPGWTVAPPDEDDADEPDDMDCFEQAAGQNFDEDADAEVSYQQSEMGPFLASALHEAGSTDDAQALVDLVAKGLQGCQGFTETDDDGTETTWSVAPLSFPDLGDGTFAARVSTMTFFGPFAIDIVVTRVEELVLFTMHAGIGAPPDAELTEEVQRLQVDRS